MIVPQIDAACPGWRRNLASIALLLAATLAAYWPALRGEFLLDDEHHVTRPELRSLSGLARIWTEVGATQQYYPALHTAFWLQHRLWGDAPLGYHLANVALHAGAALLLVAVARQLRLPGAWLAGFVFALHPVGVESVAWIAEQKNTLSTVCYLGAALAYLRFDRDRRRACYLAALGLFALALLSKTATVTLPAALLVVLWWQRARLKWRRDVLPLLPWFAAAAGASVVTVVVERHLTTAFADAFALTWLERGLVAGRALWYYLGNLLWPANLSFFHERWSVNATLWWLYQYPLAALVVAGALLVIARRSPPPHCRAARAALAALLLFAGTLFPVLGFFDVEWFVFSFVADHLQYLANLGLVVAFSAGATTALSRVAGDRGRLLCVLTAAVPAALAVLTWHHSGRFADNVTLYRHAAALHPNSALAHNHLGVALARRPGREAAAEAAYRTALRLNPEAAATHENLGDVLRRQPGRLAEAVTHYEVARRLQPGRVPFHYASAQFDLAMILARESGREPEAIAAYEAALRHDPRLAEAHYNLGNLLLQTPTRLPAAVAHYEAALRLRPDFVEAHTNLGSALAQMPGRLPEAIAHFEAALRIDPNFAPARNNLQQARQMLNSSPSPPR